MRNTLESTTMLAALVLLAAGCADDEKPEPPRVASVPIDRLGRAGVNTAVTDPFFTDRAAHGALQDTYNNASNPDQWAGLFAARFAANLAIYDGVDRTCGNQLLAGPAATAGRYDTLASVLADDRIWVDTDSASCNVYLAVEADATGVIPNSDCGGRTPLYDTIDVTYSVFVTGGIAGVTDGIPGDADGTASLTQFPFLRPPN